MHFRLLIFILFLIINHSWCYNSRKEGLENVPTKGIKPVEQTAINTIVPVSNICDKCNCTGA